MGAITYIAKREIEPTGFSKTGTDFSAIGSDDSFDAATTNISGLLTDQWLQAAGFVKNAGWFQVKSNSTSAKILTNTPPVTHLRLPGVAGNNASTPDSVAVSVTGNIELMCKVALTSWTPLPVQSLIVKDDNATNRDYHLFLDNTGHLNFLYTSDGSTTTGRLATSTLAAPFADGAIGWVKATYNTGTGLVQFFTSVDGAAFIQLGTNVTITAGAIHNGTGVLAVGANVSGISASAAGRVYYAEVRNGIGGSIVAAFDPTRGTRGAGSLVALTGETWTINTSGTPPALLQGPPLTYEGAEYMLSASNGSASTPDSTFISVTGNIELMAKVALVDWSPSTANALIAKDDVATNRDYALLSDSGSTGKLVFYYTTDGSTTTGRVATSTVAVPFADGAIGYVKATYNTATGVVQFFTSNDGVAFSQLGADRTLTAGAIHNGTGALIVGDVGNGSETINGKLYYAEVRQGIGGPVVAAFDPGRAAAGAASLVAYTGEAWTLGGAAALVRTTPVTITGYKRGFGQSYSMEFYVEKADRSVKLKRNSVQPIGGGAAEVLLQNQEATLDVTVLGPEGALITEAQMLQYREFLASVAAGEIFTFDRYGTIAAPIEPKNCQITSESYMEERIAGPGNTGLYKLAFSVRLLN